MEAKAFLVTGASGFLGYHMCKYLVTRHQTVRGMDIETFDYTDIANEINGGESGKMLERLRMLGISNTTVYPEIEGLSKELRTSKYSIREFDNVSQINPD